jgi:hypothetical protein
MTTSPEGGLSKPTTDDVDGDGLPDTTNAKMPALAFLAAMGALVPLLFGVRAAIYTFKNLPTYRMGGIIFNAVTVVLATVAIILAAYGMRARTRGLAQAAQKIGIFECLIAIGFIVALFFTGKP